MKPFNLEAALKGASVCTRSGHSVRILCADRFHAAQPVIALVKTVNSQNEVVTAHSTDGCYALNKDPHVSDLFMAPVEKSVWVNLYKDHDGRVYVGSGCYKTENEALQYKSSGTCYVDTKEITYEE